MTKHLIAFAAAAIALQGCASQTPATQYALDEMKEGIAKTCTPSAVEISATGAATATIAMTNDGWCGVFAAEKDGQPYALGLVKTRPDHGHVLIQKVNKQTRIEYTPEGRYVGTDRFTVALRSRTTGTPDLPVQISVTTTMGDFPAPPPPPPATAKKPTTPARRAAPARH